MRAWILVRAWFRREFPKTRAKKNCTPVREAFKGEVACGRSGSEKAHSGYKPTAVFGVIRPALSTPAEWLMSITSAIWLKLS